MDAVDRVLSALYSMLRQALRELALSPASNVENKVSAGATRATVFVPMTSAVTFSWAEAVGAKNRPKTSAAQGQCRAISWSRRPRRTHRDRR